jgi:hypothetical protein
MTGVGSIRFVTLKALVEGISKRKGCNLSEATQEIQRVLATGGAGIYANHISGFELLIPGHEDIRTVAQEMGALMLNNAFLSNVNGGMAEPCHAFGFDFDQIAPLVGMQAPAAPIHAPYPKAAVIDDEIVEILRNAARRLQWNVPALGKRWEDRTYAEAFISDDLRTIWRKCAQKLDKQPIITACENVVIEMWRQAEPDEPVPSTYSNSLSPSVTIAVKQPEEEIESIAKQLWNLADATANKIRTNDARVSLNKVCKELCKDDVRKSNRSLLDGQKGWHGESWLKSNGRLAGWKDPQYRK